MNNSYFIPHYPSCKEIQHDQKSSAFRLKKRRINKWKGKGRKEKVWHLSLGNVGLISEREKGKKMKVWHLSLGNVGLISEREKGEKKKFGNRAQETSD